MMFKNREHVNVKAIAAAHTGEADAAQPFNYKTEILRDVLTGSKDKLTLQYRNKHWGAFMEIAHYARHLNIEIPLLAQEDRHDFATALNQKMRAWKTNTSSSPFRIIHFLTDVVLTDPPLMQLLNADSKRTLGEVKKMMYGSVNNETASWDMLALIKMMNPQHSVQQSSALLQDLKLSRPSEIVAGNARATWRTILSALRVLASARIAGFSPTPEFSLEDWTVVRRFIDDVKDDGVLSSLAMAFYCRVIAADSVSTDENGLTIIDSRPPIATERTPPPRRHI